MESESLERQQFSAAVDSESSFAEYVLAELRCARRRAELALNEIDRIGIALKGRLIDTRTALDWLAETGTLGFLQREQPADDDSTTG